MEKRRDYLARIAQLRNEAASETRRSARLELLRMAQAIEDRMNRVCPKR